VKAKTFVNFCAYTGEVASLFILYDHSSLQYAQPELCPPTEHKVELIPGSGVYLSLARREEARREAKNGTQLARKLMDAFWDRDTLARSSLSSKSKFQYQQLDPKVINAIEGVFSLHAHVQRE